MIDSIVSSSVEEKIGRIRVLLAVDSAQYAQALSKCLANEAPDLQLVFCTDETGRTSESGDIIRLLATIAQCEPDVMVHASKRSEPEADIYSWILEQFPFLPIVHVNAEGRIRRIRQAISVDDFSNSAKEFPSNAIGRLLRAIRTSIDEGDEHASVHGFSDGIVI